MIPESFSIAQFVRNVLFNLPSFRFRDKNKKVHNASDAAKCSRAITYKAFGYPESNPADETGKMRMAFGNWVENGIVKDFLNKAGPFGLNVLSTQGDGGEYETFYGTSWHAYRDIDLAYKTVDGKLKPFVVEVKSKVGYGAQCMIKETPYSKKFIVPKPDTEWGYSQQLSLYLRDVYRKTKDNPSFSSPVTDGILLMFLFADGVCCFLEFFFEYLPEEDAARCYRVHCAQYPECSGPLDIKIDLKEIAARWAKQDECIAKGELAPPDFERRYDINDPRIADSYNTDLKKAISGNLLIGDVACKYCSFRDKCASDLQVPLEYTKAEIAVLKRVADR